MNPRTEERDRVGRAADWRRRLVRATALGRPAALRWLSIRRPQDHPPALARREGER